MPQHMTPCSPALQSPSLSGLSPFLGDNDTETLNNVLAANWYFDEETFESVSDEAKDFVSNLIIKEKRCGAGGSHGSPPPVCSHLYPCATLHVGAISMPKATSCPQCPCQGHQVRRAGLFVVPFSQRSLGLVGGAQPKPGLTDGAQERAVCGMGPWADSSPFALQRPDECRAVPAAPLAHQPGGEGQALQPPPEVPGDAQEIRHATALEGVQGWEGTGLRSPPCAAWEGGGVPRLFPPRSNPRAHFRGSGQRGGERSWVGSWASPVSPSGCSQEVCGGTHASLLPLCRKTSLGCVLPTASRRSPARAR